MTLSTDVSTVEYACPKCKRPVSVQEAGYGCAQCGLRFPVRSGIPDFLLVGSPMEQASIRQITRGMDLLAPIYENRFWYQTLLNLSGAGSHSLADITAYHAGSLNGVSGAVLDVACGPATYTRRVVRPDRTMFGVDISMGVLRQGKQLLEREGVSGVRLARARAEDLPFADGVLDGIVCSGSLHLFPDTVRVLRECIRAMKPGAVLSVQTFVTGGDTAFLRLLGRWRTVKAFELPVLEKNILESGFVDFQPSLDGVFLAFRARKQGG